MQTSITNPPDKHIDHNSNPQALLIIAEARVQIYSDCIVASGQKFEQLKTNDTGQFSTILDENKFEQALKKEEGHRSSTKQRRFGENNKVIMFNNPDFAFQIKQEQKSIQIYDLITHKVQLKIKVNLLQTMLTVQTLLRKKMCELGFEKKYKKVKLLGKGATAQVHLIERITDGKQFAAKIISIKNSNDKCYETFINESKLLRFLKHKNIIQLESLYIHKKQLIQVMEYLSGGTLLQLIRNDQLKDKQQKWKVLRDLTSALDYLRQRRIVHRDIKLQNILIREVEGNRQYVLSDFGLACWTGEKNPVFERCGTPGYIAPQVLNTPKGKPILNHKTDIFSLGAIAHILFLHQSLFPYSGSIKQLLKLNKKADFSLQSSLYKDLSLSEMTFLELSLAKKPEQRATATLIIQQLKYQFNSGNDATPKKSVRESSNSTQIKLDPLQFGVQVKIKKQTSLTKRKIDLSVGKVHSQQKSSQKREVSSARKLFSDMWASLTSSAPKKQRLKIKQNSLEKHKKLAQFF